MASYLVYVDGHEESSGRDVLAACGLSSLVSEHEPDPTPVAIGQQGGPTGQSGVVLLPYLHGDERDPAVMYRADRQTWQRVNGPITYWIGWENDNPPTPRDLERPRQYVGRAMTLNGSRWTVPWCFATQRRFGIKDGVPHIKEEPLVDAIFQVAAPAYQRLEQHFVDMLAGQESGYNPAAELEAAATILGFNYRVTMQIALALELFTTSDIVGVIARATNLDRIAELQAIKDGLEVSDG